MRRASQAGGSGLRNQPAEPGPGVGRCAIICWAALSSRGWLTSSSPLERGGGRDSHRVYDRGRPPCEVLAYLTDPSRFGERQWGVASGRMNEDRPPAVGSKFTATTRIGGGGQIGRWRSPRSVPKPGWGRPVIAFMCRPRPDHAAATPGSSGPARLVTAQPPGSGCYLCCGGLGLLAGGPAPEREPQRGGGPVLLMAHS
jgi:hypothetical protein